MLKYINKFVGGDGKTRFCIDSTTCCETRTEWLHGNKPLACPVCGDKYFDKPLLEWKLFHLQDEFLEDYAKTKSTRILGEKMFPLIREYAENLIKALLKGKTCISRENLYEKANDAATMLIEVIMKDKGHRMNVSFGAYLQRLCRSVAFKDKDNDRMYSMEYLIGDDTEFGDTISRKDIRMNEAGEQVEETVTMNNRYEEQNRRIENDVSRELCDLIGKSSQIIRESSGIEKSWLFLIGLYNKFVYKNDRVMNGFYEIAGNEVRRLVEKGEMVVFGHLKQMAGVY
jgi:hypothetical protein